MQFSKWNHLPLYLILVCLGLTACKQDIDAPGPAVSDEVVPVEPEPPIEPEKVEVKTGNLLDATGSPTSLALILAGTYHGTCEYVESNQQTGGPVTSTGPRTFTVTAVPGNNEISLGGPTVYTHISGTDPMTEIIKYRNDGAFFPGILSFDFPNNRLDYSWGAGSPGGYATENCTAYR